MITTGAIILLSIFLGSFSGAQSRPQWSEGEHLELGDQGVLRACAELGLDSVTCPYKNIPRADKKVRFTYGEIVVSADYYHTAQNMYLDKQMGIKKVLKCAQKMHMDHPTHRPDESKYDGCEKTGIWNMPGYFEIISQNYNHLGWNNMKAYVSYHQNALVKARQAFIKRKTNWAESQDLFAQALVLNAYADHYLTDAFAAGHIRMPRIEIKEWAKKNLFGFFKATRGDVLAILLHENESRDLKSGREIGLTVQNSRGDNWLTRGDQYLRIDSDLTEIGYRLPVEAVKESVKEVLKAWQTGQMPDGVFQAALYVPFALDIPLAEKLSASHLNMRKRDFLRSLYSTLPSVLGWIFPKSDFEKMHAQLPQIFSKFRQNIARDMENDENLKQRLPAAYVEAYLKIQ